MSPSSVHPHAFTMIELIFVLVVLAVVLAIAAPRMNGFLTGSRFNDSADELVAAASHARSRAIAQSRVYRLNFSPDGTSYQLTMQQGEEFVPLGTEFGRVIQLPDGERMTLQRADNQDASYIEFRPDGTSDPATITLQLVESGQTIVVQSESSTEPFWKASGGRRVGL